MKSQVQQNKKQIVNVIKHVSKKGKTYKRQVKANRVISSEA